MICLCCAHKTLVEPCNSDQQWFLLESCLNNKLITVGHNPRWLKHNHYNMIAGAPYISIQPRNAKSRKIKKKNFKSLKSAHTIIELPNISASWYRLAMAGLWFIKFAFSKWIQLFSSRFISCQDYLPKWIIYLSFS